MSVPGPEFRIDHLLGKIPSSDSAPSVAKQFHDKMEEAHKDLEEKTDREGKSIDPSWLHKGHPMGDKVGKTKLAELGFQGLLRFGGAGIFGGALKKEQEGLEPLNADPLQYMVDFLEQLAGSDGEQVRADFRIDQAEIQDLAKRMHGAAELARKVVEVRGAGKAQMPAAISEFADQLVSQLAKDGVIYFPLADEKGKYHQIVRVDKEHGFSIIEVDENHSPYVTDVDSLKSLGIRQDVVKHTSIDPLTKKKVESYKTQQFVSFEAKNKERIGDKYFFESLIKGAVLQGVAEDFDAGSAADLIYESLPKYVNGKRLKSSDTQSEMYRKVYRYFDNDDKDSSFQSITATLYYMCLDPFFEVKKDHSNGINTFKRIKFLLQSQLFIANVTKLEEDHDWNTLTPDKKVFLQDLKANLMRSAERLLRRDALEAEHIEPFLRACKQVDSILARPILLEKAQTADESEVIARQGAIEVMMGAGEYPNTEPERTITIPGRAQPIGFGSNGVHGADQTVEAKPVEQMICHLGKYDYSISFDTANADQDVAKLHQSVEHLTQIYRVLRENPTLQYRRPGAAYISSASKSERRAVFDMYSKVLGDLIAQLPAPKRGGDGYWVELSAEQKKQYFDKIEELTLLVQSFATLERQYNPISRDRELYRHTPETSIMMFALQTLQLKLASQLPEFHLEEQSFSHMHYLLEMRAKDFVVDHSGLRKLVFDYMQYHNLDWNIEQITGQLTAEDYKVDDKKLFSFTKTGERKTDSWVLSLDPSKKKKGVDQLYLEKMLEVEGVREGVKAIIQKKNDEYDRKHKEAIELYKKDYKKYQEEKEGLENKVRQKKVKLDAINQENEAERSEKLGDLEEKDLRKLRRLFVAKQQMNALDQWDRIFFEGQVETLTNELQHIDKLDRRLADFSRLYGPCIDLENAISKLRNEVNLLIEPKKPEHEGHYPLDSLIDQLACLLFDPEGRKLIPNEMNQIIQSVLRGKYLIEKGTLNFELDRGMYFTFKGSWVPLPLESQNKRRPIDMSIHVAMGDEEPEEVYCSERFDHMGVFQCLDKQLRTRRDRYYESWDLKTLNSDSFDPNYTQNRIMHSTQLLFNLDVRTTRELRMIGLDPYDTVSRTIAFLNRNMGLVQNQTIRDYINELLFRPERIHTQLRDNPHLCKKIDQFIRQTVKHYAEVKDIDTCLAVIQLGKKLKESAAEIGITEGFSSYRELVLKVIIPAFEMKGAAGARVEDNREAQLKAYRTILMMHANNSATEDLDEEKKNEIIEDILSFRICRQLQTSRSHVSDDDDVVTQQVLLRYQHLLDDRINDKVLTAVLGITGQGDELADAKWSTDRNTGIYSCGRYKVDSRTGQIFVDENPLVVTPAWITSSETLRRVYPYSFNSRTCEKVNEFHYILNKGNKEKEVHVISIDRGESIQIERLIDGKSYRYLETPDSLCKSKPTIFDENVICWINEACEILVFKNGEKAFSLRLDKDAGPCTIQSLNRLVDKAVALPFNTDLNIANPFGEGGHLNLSRLFTNLFPFERNQSYIECWAIKDKILVDFKRLGLSFELRMDELNGFGQREDIKQKFSQLIAKQAIVEGSDDEKEKAKAEIEVSRLSHEIMGQFPIHCQNFPGFNLSLPVLLQSLLNIREQQIPLPYVTLESDSGERKVLIPRPEDGRFVFGEGVSKWYEYDVVKVKSDGITSHDLASHNVEEQLIQMLMCTKQRNFAKIQTILDRFNPLQALTEWESKTLNLVIMMLFQYQHPEANALILKLILLKDVNALKFAPAESLNPQDQAGNAEEVGPEEALEKAFQDVLLKAVAYENYRKTSSKASSYQLTREEERQFVEILYHELREKSEEAARFMRRDGQANSIPEKIMKAVQNKATEFLPILFLGLAEQRFGQRYDDLETGEGKLGTKKVELITAPSIEGAFSGDEQKPLLSGEKLEKLFLIELIKDKSKLGKPVEEVDVYQLLRIFQGEDEPEVEFNTQLEIPKDADIDQVFDALDKNAQYWENNFYILYHIARSGTEDQKDKLQRALDLATHTNAGGHRLLRWVMRKPSRYPTLEKINQKLKKWLEESPEKIKSTEIVENEKQRLLSIASREHVQAEEEVNGLNDQANRLLDWYSLKTVKSNLAKAKSNLEKERQKPYNQQWGVRDLESEISSYERKIREYENLKPLIKEAKEKEKKAARELRIARRAYVKADNSLKKAREYHVKMQNDVMSACTSTLPNRVWSIIQDRVRPIFKAISQGWKLFKQGRTLLYKRVYPVRDIFSSREIQKNRKTMNVDRTFLQDIDESFNDYFNGLVKEYFVVKSAPETKDHEWKTRDNENRKVAEEKKLLKEYRDEVRQVRKQAKLKSKKNIDDLMSELSAREQVLSVSLVQQKEALVWQLNRIVNDDDPQNKVLVELNRGGLKGDLTWEDLKKLTLNGDPDEFKEKTGLDDSESIELMRGVADYLVKATRLNQLRFVKGKVAKAQGAKDEEKQEVYHTNIVEALELTRHYLSEKEKGTEKISPQDMRRLWFEHANGYLYRKEQIDLLDTNGDSSEPEILTEAPTGFGKSKTYIPSLNIIKSLKKLVFNIHPRTIERINAEDNQQQMHDAFGRKVDRFHFQRSTKFTAQSLKKIYEELQFNLEEGYPINCSAESLQALELHFLESLYKYKEADKSGKMSSKERVKAKQQIEYFMLILRAISVYGWATIDESHVNLNPFSNKLIYTIGKSDNLESYQIDILEEIMDLMDSEPEIAEVAKIAQNQQARVSADDYDKIARNLAEHFADKYRIDNEKREEFFKFVLGELDDVPHWIAKHPQSKKFALVKGMLSLILKSCMDGYVDENFGLSKLHFDKGKEYAIAFASANTPKENETNPSQFKNPHETMIKTYLTYLHKGLKESQVIKMLKQMKKQQLLESRITGSLSNTDTNKAFHEIAGEGCSLHELTEDDMKALCEDFRLNKKAIFYYVRNIIVPQLKLYNKTLVSTPQNLRSLFQTSESLSATPQHPATHGPDTVMVPMPGTQGQVTHLFLKKVDSEKKIHTSKGSSPQDVLESAVDTVLKNDHIKCIVDAGALMRGLTNEHIANTLRREILERGTEGIEAIQYFDVEKEKFVVMEVSTGTLSDPTVVKIDPAKIRTIFDQPRCFGSDTVQDELAAALLLVDQRTEKGKSGQGAGRMRQWHLDQGIEVMMTQEDHGDLFGNKTANIDDLLKHWVKNLDSQERKENYPALLQQMDNELRSPAMQRMLGIRRGDSGQETIIRDKKPDVDKALRLFSKFESILVTEDTSDPWKLYAEIPTDQDPETSLDAHLKRTKAQARQLSGFSSSQGKMIKSRLGRYSKKWRAPGEGEENQRISLPAKVKASKVDTGTQVEVQVHAEEETEVEVEEQRWDEFVERTPSKWSNKIDLFKRGWEKPRRQFVFLNRLGRSISKLEPESPILKVVFRAGIVVAGTVLAASAASIAGIAGPIIAAVGCVVALAGLAYVAYSAFAGRNVKYVDNCTYKVRDIMASHLPLSSKRGARFFSPNLTVSNNYYAQRTPNFREKEQQPFTQEQKPAFNVLVIEDIDKKGRSRLQMMLIDQNDSVYFRRRLQADYEKASEEEVKGRTRKVAVYDVTNGLIAVQGKNGFKEDELEGKTEFVELLVQAKVINGDIHFSDEEKDAITARAQKVGAEPMEDFAQDHILSEHPVCKALFGESDLKKAFEAVS